MILCPFSQIGRYSSVIPGLEEAVQAIAQLGPWEPGVVNLPSGNRILVQEYDSKSVDQMATETHRNFLDIQYILEGEEWVGWASMDKLTPETPYSAEKDVQFFTGELEYIRIPAGYCYAVYPEDGHKPGIFMESPSHVKKLVLKLRLV